MQITIAPDINEVLTVIISTGLLFLIMKKFFWNSMSEYIQKRADFIAEKVEGAKAVEVEADQKLEMANQMMKDARVESKEMIEKAKHTASQTKEEILEQAKKEAEHKMKSARVEIEKEREDLRNSIQEEIVEVAFAAAKKVVKGNIDETKNKEIINSFIEELE